MTVPLVPLDHYWQPKEAGGTSCVLRDILYVYWSGSQTRGIFFFYHQTVGCQSNLLSIPRFSVVSLVLRLLCARFGGRRARQVTSVCFDGMLDFVTVLVGATVMRLTIRAQYKWLDGVRIQFTSLIRRSRELRYMYDSDEGSAGQRRKTGSRPQVGTDGRAKLFNPKL
jgi:hypothetical protein